MDFRHLIVTCLFSKLRLPFDNQKVKENYAIFIIIFPLFLLFSKKYKVILLFICVLTFYIGSVSDIFSSYPSKRPVSSSFYAILYFFPLSVIESGNYCLVFKRVIY